MKKENKKVIVKFICLLLAVVLVVLGIKNKFVNPVGEYYWGFLFAFGAVLFIVGGVCIYAWDKKLEIEKMFIIIALASGIGMALINPLGQEPDGWTHFRRAIDVSYGNVLAPFKNTAHKDGYNIVPKNMEDIHFKNITPCEGEGYEYTKNLINIRFSKETVQIEGENGYTSLYYMPQALGTLIGRILNLSIYTCMVLGRILNLLCYTVLTYWALKLMPIYKNLLAVIALLPITLYQAASYSPDALLNGICFLFVALCFHYAFGEKEKLSWRNVIILGIMLGVMLMCKYVYVCLGLLVFLIPIKKFGSRKAYWKAFGVAVLPILAALIAYAVMFAINLNAGENVTAVLESGDIADGTEAVTMTQFDYVRQNPFVLVKILPITIWSCFSIYVKWLNTLGALNFSMGILETIIPCFMIGVACLDTSNIQQKVKIKHRILFLAAGVMTTVTAMLGLYFMDAVANPVGARIIQGYQTRYAIPCMVLLLSMFGSGKVTNKINNFSVKVLGCMGLFLVCATYMLVRICY